MSTKKVVYKNRNKPLHIVERPIDKVDKKDILVKVHSCGLNPVEELIRTFTLPVANLFCSEFGVGYDFAGEVVEIGAEAALFYGFKIGDEVFGQTSCGANNRTLTQYLKLLLNEPSVLPDDFSIKMGIAKKPQSLSMNEAASVPLVYSTAVGLASHLKSSTKKVLINGGATSVGKYLIPILKLQGIPVTAICSGASAPTVEKLGADIVIDYKKGNIVVPILETCVDEKYDAVFDLVGSKDILDNLYDITIKEGVYVSIAPGNKKLIATAIFDPYMRIHFKRMFLYLFGFSLVYNAHLSVIPGVGYDKIGNWFDRGILKPHVHSVYKLEDFQKAYDVATSGISGKVVIELF